ncbi:MAG: hypothetical protein JST89_01935 [Cyanobacteria bacterium SZAS-4]|nr:hypothetical protein [Cyanobacteria bacterium SZAS-4]
MNDDSSLAGLFSDNYLAKLAATSGLSRDLLAEIQLAKFSIEDHERAVVFYHGVWSGPSVAPLRLLCSAMATARGQFPILLVNADSLDVNNRTEIAKAKELFGPFIGAWGETCWIKNGAIIAQDILGRLGPMHESSKDFSSTLKQGKRLQGDEQLLRTLDELKRHIVQRIELVIS